MAKPKAASVSIVRAKVDLPVDAKAIMATRVAALSKQLAAPSGKAISCVGKTFKFPGAETTPVDTFKGIIVAFSSYNAYYENPYDANNKQPPSCYAVGLARHDDLVASSNSPDPQHQENEPACKTCWANQFKSAATGAGKACKNSIRLAILCQDGELRTLAMSSTAITPFKLYVDGVVDAFRVAPFGVLTMFGFDPKQAYGSIRCSAPLVLNDDQLGLAMSLIDQAEAMILTEPDVSEFEAKVVALRAKKPVKGKVAAKRA